MNPLPCDDDGPGVLRCLNCGSRTVFPYWPGYGFACLECVDMLIARDVARREAAPSALLRGVAMAALGMAVGAGIIFAVVRLWGGSAS